MNAAEQNPPAAALERRIAINVGSRYVAQILSITARFFITPYLVYKVGHTQFGLQVLAFQVTLFLSLFADCLGASYNRYAAAHYARRNYDEMNATLTAGVLLALAAAVIFATVGITAAILAKPLFGLNDADAGVLRIVLLITVMAAAVRVPLRVWTSATHITQSFYQQSLTTSLHILTLIPVALLAFQLYRPSIITWVALDEGLNVFYLVCVGIPLARRALPQFHFRPKLIRSWEQVKPLLTFGSLRVMGELAFLLYFASDSVIISKLPELGPAMIVYFAIAQRWVPQILFLLMAFVGTLTPLMTSDHAVGNIERIRNTFVRAVRYCYILALFPCVMLLVFADPFIRHWMGNDFAEISTPALRLIMLGFIPVIPGQVALQVLIASARIGRHVTVSLAGGILNIILSVWLVKTTDLGLCGIALANVITLSLSYATTTPFTACRAVGLPLRKLLAEGYARPLIGAVPLALAGMILMRVWPPGNLFMVFVEMGICGVVYALAAWPISMTHADRIKVTAVAAAAMRRLRQR